MTTLALAIAPDLVFEFRDIDERLLGRIADFLGFYHGAEDASGALVISGAPAPVKGLESSRVLLEEDNLVVRRAGGVTLFELAGGISAWCDAGTASAGVTVDSPAAGARELFVWRVLAGLLMELAEAKRWLGLHGAGSVVEGRGLLLTGPSGVGKSTLIGRLHQAGHGVLSDDLIWLARGAGGFEAIAFPRGAPRPPAPAPTVARSAVAAVICPVLVDRDASSLATLSTDEVLAVLIEQSGFLGAAATTARRFKTLVRLAASVPAFRLEAGRSQEEIPPLLARLAAGLA